MTESYLIFQTFPARYAQEVKVNVFVPVNLCYIMENSTVKKKDSTVKENIKRSIIENPETKKKVKFD